MKNIFSDPQHIFNTDETAFLLSPKSGKVLTKMGVLYVHKIGNDEKECITVMMTIIAARQTLLPMIIFKSNRLPAYITNLAQDEWGVDKSDWMEVCTNIFSIHVSIFFSVDGYIFITLQVLQLCEQNGGVFVCLPANSTHITQPMNIAVFHPLKVAWRRATECCYY